MTPLGSKPCNPPFSLRITLRFFTVPPGPFETRHPAVFSDQVSHFQFHCLSDSLHSGDSRICLVLKCPQQHLALGLWIYSCTFQKASPTDNHGFWSPFLSEVSTFILIREVFLEKPTLLYSFSYNFLPREMSQIICVLSTLLEYKIHEIRNFACFCFLQFL